MSRRKKEPLGRGHCRPQGYNIGRSPQKKATYQVPKAICHLGLDKTIV